MWIDRCNEWADRWFPPPVVVWSALGVVLMCFAGCSAAQKHAEADAAYATDQLRCVDENTTRAEIDACREIARRRWGIYATTADAGSEAGAK